MSFVVFDPYSGASGDMLVAVLAGLLDGMSVQKLEASDPLGRLNAMLDSLHPGLAFRFFSEKRNGIVYRRAEVEVLHEHSEGHGHHHSHHHGTSWRRIREQLAAASAGHPSMADATAVFARLARAESKAHGVLEDDVHFHEAGALDSIADICGAAFLMKELRNRGVTAFFCLPLGAGYGTINCAHGIISNPAPATVGSLEGSGLAMVQRQTTQELVTPTAAAILAELTLPCPDDISGAAICSSSSTGSREWSGLPSFLTARVLEDRTPSEKVTLIEANIDDMTGEELAEAARSLLEVGALDVWLTPIVMKKGRPGLLLSVLCESGQTEVFASAVLSETTTVGCRYSQLSRKVLPRRTVTVVTSLGPVVVKLSGDPASIAKPEAESICGIAKETGLSFAEVRRRVTAELPALLDGFVGMVV